MKKPWHIKPVIDEHATAFSFRSFKLVGISHRKWKKHVRTECRKAGIEVSFTYVK
jgi:hypothetical protein